MADDLPSLDTLIAAPSLPAATAKTDDDDVDALLDVMTRAAADPSVLDTDPAARALVARMTHYFDPHPSLLGLDAASDPAIAARKRMYGLRPSLLGLDASSSDNEGEAEPVYGLRPSLLGRDASSSSDDE